MTEIPSFRSSINGFHRGDVIEFLKKILDENAFLTEILSRVREENNALQAEIESLKAQIEGFHTDRQNEQVLGRALYDARRFSDVLVQEANDQAKSIMSTASTAAEDVTAQVTAITEQADALETCFKDSIANVSERLTALTDLLEIFRKDVEEKKSVYFTPEDTEPLKTAEQYLEESADEAPAEEALKKDDESASAHVRLTVRKVKRTDGNK